MNPYKNYTCTLKSVSNMLSECAYELSELPELAGEQLLKMKIKELQDLISKTNNACARLENNKGLIRKSNE